MQVLNLPNGCGLLGSITLHLTSSLCRCHTVSRYLDPGLHVSKFGCDMLPHDTPRDWSSCRRPAVNIYGKVVGAVWAETCQAQRQLSFSACKAGYFWWPFCLLVCCGFVGSASVWRKLTTGLASCVAQADLKIYAALANLKLLIS